ncbi:hypothetical protein FPRO04_04500 [Fusarium proliferatum]|nr:hypothetical protein FPRO03_02699 [Fusarium proliferatum]KAG4268084.1 hypothetical protein FPRO04_04500 [Fusarium proliferatum]
MVSTAVTTQDDLNSILQAGSQGVLDSYREFRIEYPKKSLAEVGLTDKFMVAAQKNARLGQKDVHFERSSNENLTCSDLQVKVDGKYWVFFQAKVAKKKDGETYANFVNESKKGDAPDFQNILLAQHAKKLKTAAYYVIYDETAVWWVNAIALMSYLNSGVSGGDVDVCIRAFKELAKESYLKAMADPWQEHLIKSKF